MIQFLLTTSLVLHLLTFLWIITLLQKVNNQQTSPINEEKLKRDIEDLLVAYTTEMKEENEFLLEQIKKYQQTSTATKNGDEKENGQQKTILKTATVKSKKEHKGRVQAQPKEKVKYEEYQPPEIEGEKPDLYEQSNTAKVLLLSKQGLSSEEIAKKLNLGKGEVELMIKFYH
ncbi:DUF6115 domain-containing protein [Alkalihalobacillus sp. BA299]|uniref:DUF6115 domain-containing protein n=1 Tax=Alkalihalobacillus sp. BA299 TaxID=2815938 RepID=UPI001ADB31D0|nr:hypothetical protein [Alkalihalobacillus sp. BA299]